MEMEMAKLMTPADGTEIKGAGGTKSGKVAALSVDLARQVERVKAVLGVSGIKYMQNKGKIGWNERDWLIWILLTFEGKIKSESPSQLKLCVLIVGLLPGRGMFARPTSLSVLRPLHI
jgi:hypothetical protein